MKIRFLKIAEFELDQAISYYNSEEPGLGDEFLQEIFAALDRIADFPQAWQMLSPRTRRCLLRRFPYGIIYHQYEQKNEILIIAVAHLHKRPEYWKDRIDS